MRDCTSGHIELINSLAGIYVFREDARAFVVDLEMDTSRITWSEISFTCWQSILEAAIAQGRLDLLIERAANENPGNNALQRARAMRPYPPLVKRGGTPAQAHESARIERDAIEHVLAYGLKDDPFDPLRYNPRPLAEREIDRFLQSEEADQLVLLITGDSGSGKSALIFNLLRTHLDRLDGKAPYVPGIRPSRVFFYMGETLEGPGFIDVVQDDLRRAFGLDVPDTEVFAAVDTAVKKQRMMVLVVIDGVNETKAAEALLGAVRQATKDCMVRGVTHIRFLLTTQRDTFRDRKIEVWLGPYLYKTEFGARTVPLGDYSDQELDAAIARIRQRRPGWVDALDAGNEETRNLLCRPSTLDEVYRVFLDSEHKGHVMGGATLATEARKVRHAAAQKVAKDAAAVSKVRELLGHAKKPSSLLGSLPIESRKHLKEWQVVEFAARELSSELTLAGLDRGALDSRWLAVLRARIPEAPSWYRQALRLAVDSANLKRRTLRRVLHTLLCDEAEDCGSFAEELIVWLWVRPGIRQDLGGWILTWLDGTKPLTPRVLRVLGALHPRNPALLRSAMREMLTGTKRKLDMAAPFLQQYLRGGVREERSPEALRARAEDTVNTLTEAVLASNLLQILPLGYLSFVIITELAQPEHDDGLLELSVEQVRIALSRRFRSIEVFLKDSSTRLLLSGLGARFVRHKLERLPRDNPQNYDDLSRFLHLDAPTRELLRGLSAYLVARPLDGRLKEIMQKVADVESQLVRSLGEFALFVTSRKSREEVLDFLPKLFAYTWEKPKQRSAAMQSVVFIYFSILSSLSPTEIPNDRLALWFSDYEAMLESMMLDENSPRGVYTTGRGRIMNPNLNCYLRLRKTWLPHLPVEVKKRDLLEKLIRKAFSGDGDEELLELLLSELQATATEHAWSETLPYIGRIVDGVQEMGKRTISAAASMKRQVGEALAHVRVYLPVEVDYFLRERSIDLAEWGVPIRTKGVAQRAEEKLSVASHLWMFRLLEAPNFVAALRRVLDRVAEGTRDVPGWLLDLLDEVLIWLYPPVPQLR